METSPPEAFAAFLQAILQAETQADLWKAKLFYFSPDQIVSFLETQSSETSHDEESAKQTEQNFITLESLVSLIQKTQQNDHTFASTDRQKVISKYFGFNQISICPRDQFMKRLKPTDNKLILAISKNTLKLDESLSGLLQCILSGYENIKQKREQCAQNILTILSYFHSQMGYYKGLSKQSLKQITFQMNTYGRINFTYLKEYIFGQDQEIIGWESLFGVKINQGIEKIQELSQQNIASENFIRPTKSRINFFPDDCSERSYGMTPNKQSIYIESVSEIKNVPEPISISKIHMNEDYSKALNEINQIESLLNKTKQKYQKNRENLQNQTEIIKSQHLRRSQNLGKFTSSQKNLKPYEGLKITQSRKKVVESVQQKDEQNHNEVSNVSIWQRPIQTQKVEPKRESPYKVLKASQMQQSIIRPLITRQQMKKQISSTINQRESSCVTPSQNTLRQAGKIKRRSVSRDVPNTQTGGFYQQRYSQNTTNYSEYEAVLMEIKREECKFNKMVDERENILYGRQIVTKAEFRPATKMHRQSPLYVSLTGELGGTKTPVQRDSKAFTFQNSRSNSRSSSRYSYSKNQAESAKNISRSRVSTKKREEIVQKATSEARMRIQQIENRALKRIAKIDTELHQKNVSKHSTYLKLESGEASKASDTPKYRLMKENTPSMIRSQKSPQTKSFLFNDLLNERPNLKLSTYSSIYQPKY